MTIDQVGQLPRPLVDAFTSPNVPLDFNLSLGDLGSITTTGQAGLGADVTFDFTFGFNLARTGDPQLAGTLAGTLPANGQLVGDAKFAVTLGAQAPVTVTIPASSTAADASTADLVNVINAAIAGTSLNGLVQASVKGGVIALATTSATTLPLTVAAPLTLPGVTSPLVNPAVGQLGLPGDGNLGAPSTFTLSDGVNDLATLNLASGGNTRMVNPQDPLDATTLVGEINRALEAAGLLTSATYDPTTGQSTYAGKVYADAPGGSLANIIRFNAVSGSGLAHLKIEMAATDPMATILGFTDGQTASGTVGDVFISTTPLLSAHAGLSATNFGATAQFGPVVVSATDGTARADAYLSLGLHDPANPTASTVSLATLVHEFGQRDFSGIASVKLNGSGEFSLGGLSVAGISLPQPAGSAAIAVTLPNLQSSTDTLTFNSGVLAGPASFAVTLPGQAPVTVTVPRSAAAGDTSMEDLAAAVNAAIQAAGLGQDVAARVDAGAITFLPLGTAGATVSNVTGFAPTGVLAGDATFTVAVADNAGDLASATPVTVTVKQADTAGDASLADLAAKINAVLGTAGIGAKVQAVVNGAEIRFIPLPTGSTNVVGVSDFYTLSTPALGSLLDLRHISVTSVIAGLQSVAHLIDAADPSNSSSQLAFLNEKLPLINLSAKDLVDYASSFLNQLDAVAQDPAASLQALQTELDNALGISPSSPEQVTLAYDTSVAGHPALKVGLTYTQTYDNEASFSLDLPGLARLVNAPSSAVTALENLASLVDTDLAANLHVNAYARLALEFGIDLTNPLAPRPFLYDGSPTAGGTGVTLGVEVDGTGLNFKAALGPIGIFVTNGTVSLGSSTTGDGHAQFSVSILDADGTGRHYLTDPIASDFTVGLVGSVTATLPLYGPTSDLPIGGAGHNNLVLSVPNLQALLTGSGIAGSVSITTPDISALAVPNPIALLRNPAILVNGLDSALGSLQSALDSQVLQTSLPVVGSALASSDQFITDFRQGVLAKIQATLASLPNGDPTQALANALTAFFGSGNGGLGLLAQGSTVTTTTDSQNNPTLVQFNMHLHKDVTFRQAFNLGLSAVGLSLDGTGAVMVSLGYDFYFEFGVSTKYGLYVDTTPVVNGVTEPVFRITAEATTPGLDVTGTLGFLQVQATDGQGNSQVVLTPLQQGLAGVTASYVVSNALAAGHETVAYNSTAQTLIITVAPTSTVGGVVAAINNDPVVKLLFEAAVGGTSQASAALDTTIAPGRGTSLIGSFVVNLADPKQPSTPLSANDGDHFLAATDLAGSTFSQIVQPTFNLAADVNLHLLVDIKDGNGNAADFPSIQTDFHLGWSFTAGFNGVSTGKPTVDFDKVQLDLGAFISNFVAPIVNDVKQVLDPIKPIVDILTTPLPVISDLAGHSVTLEDLAALFGSPYSQIKTFTDAYNAIYSIINSIPTNPGDILINLGDFHFGGASDDLTGKGQLPAAADSSTTMADPIDQLGSGNTKSFAQQLNQVPNDPTDTTTVTKSADFTIKFPLLSHEAPQTILALLTGRTADLFEFDMTEHKIGFNYRQIFPIFGPLAATLGGGITADLKFAFGYDTTGIQEAMRDKSQGAAVIAKDLADGFYIRTDDGPQITLDGDIVAGAALSIEVATAGVEGGVFAHITASLVDPDGTGKLRYQEIQHLVDPDGNIADIMPLCLFNIAGNLSFKLYAYVDAGPIHYQQQIVDPITLLSFSLMCPGDPILSSEDLQGGLTLNMGPDAANRTYGDVADDNEDMRVYNDAKNPSTVDVTYYKADGSQVQKNDGTGPLVENHASVTNVVADGGAGDNTIDVSGTSLPATLSAGDGNNTIVAGAGTTTVSLGNGNNAVRVGDGNDTITAGSGNNAITIGSGEDAISVGPGYDTITESDAASAADTLTVSGATKYVLTPTSIESLDAGGNVVGTLTVVDAHGNPVALNTFASITLDGAAGDDTFDVSRWTSGGLTLAGSGDGGTDTVLSDNSATTGALTFGLSDASLTRSDGASIALTNINQARLTGSQGTDVFNVSGWTGTAILASGPGSSAHNTFNVTGSRATLPAVTITGNGGIDALNFTLNGDAAAGSDPSVVSTSAVPVIHFTNADSGHSETWSLDRGGLSAGGRALLATVGATNSTLTFGADGNAISILDVATATTIDAHTGTNTIQVGDAIHPIRDIAAPLVILGNPTHDTLTVDDEANNYNSTDQNFGAYATGEVDALAGQTDLGQPVPGQVIGLGMASGGQAGLIQFAARALAVTLGTGANAFTVRGTTVPVTITGQQAPAGGSVGNNAITVLDAQAAVSVVGGGGQDTLTLDRTADAAAHGGGQLTYQNGQGTISGLGLSTVTYQGLTHLIVKLGTGNSQLTVANTMANAGADSTVINTYSADDRVTVQAVGDSTTVVGQPGKDTITVNFTAHAPQARQFKDLHLAPVHLLVVDNSGPAAGVHWVYTAGQYFLSNETASNDYVVDSAGADSSQLKEGSHSELDITNTVPTDQTATVGSGQAQLGVGSNVLTPVTNGFVQGTGGLGYVATADGLVGAVGSVTSPDGKYVYIISNADVPAAGNDPATSGSIAVYGKVAATGKLIFLNAIKFATGNGSAAAQGVEHAVAVAMSPDGKQVYVLGDLGVGIYNRDASTGLLSLNYVEGSYLNPTLRGGTTLAVSPDGLDVYVGVPSQDLIAVLNRDPSSGGLSVFGASYYAYTTAAPTSETIKITPDGHYLYLVDNAFGTTFDVFRRDVTPGDANYGLIDEIGPEAVSVPTATTTNGATLRSYSLNFTTTSRLTAVSPDGRFAYVASDPGNGRGGEVRAYRRDPQTGDFSELITTFSDYNQDQYGLQGATQLVVSPDGLDLYVVGGLSHSGNTQHDYITVFSIDPQTGALTYGETLGVGSPYTNFEQTLALAVSPDSQHVFAISSNGAQIEEFSRSADRTKLSGYTQIRTGQTTSLYSPGGSIAVSPDDKYLYVECYQTNTVLGYALNANGLLPTGNPYPNYTFNSINSDGLSVAADPNGFAMSPDGSLLYMATTDGEVRVDARGGAGQLTNVAHIPAPGFTPTDTAVALSPDGQRVYVTYTRSNGATLLEVYRLNSGNSFTPASGSDQEDGGLPYFTTTAPAISPDGYVYLAAEGTAGVAVLKDDGTGVLTNVQSMTAGQGGALIAGATSLATSTDGLTAYVAGPGSNGLSVFRQYSGSDAPNTYIAQWLTDGVVLNGQAVSGLNGAGPVGVSPDGKELYVIGATEDNVDATGGTLAVFTIDPATGLLTGEVQTITNASFYQASEVSVSPDGGSVDVLGANKNVLVRYRRDATSGLLSLANPQTIQNGTPTLGLQDLAAVTLSPDGSYAYALAPDDGGLVVFARDPATGKLDLASGQPQEILFDGETLTVPAGGTRPQAITSTQTVGLSGASAMTMSPDGRQLFVVSPAENTLAVFDRDPATGLLTFRASFQDQANLSGPFAVAVSGDGQTILVQSARHTVGIFSRDATSGSVLLSTIDYEQIPGTAIDTTGTGPVAFSPEAGTRVAYFADAAAGTLAAYAVDTAGNLTLLATYANGQVVNGQAIAGLGGASAIAFSPDGRYLFVTGAADDALVVFTRNPTTGLLTFSQELRDGVDGVQGLGGAAAIAVSPVYADVDAKGNPVNDQFVFVAGAAENELAVFGIDTNPADANYGKFVFLQRLSNGAVAGLGTPNSVVVGPNRTVYVGSSTGTAGTGGGVALFTIAASVPPPTQYTIAYSGLSTFKVTTGAGNDTLDVLGTPAYIATTFNTGTGVDEVNFQGLGVAGVDDSGTNVILKDGNGSTASETVNIRSINAGVGLQVNTGGGTDNVYVWATGRGSATTLNTQSSKETVQVLGTGLFSNPTVPTSLTVNNANALLFDPGGNPLDAGKTTFVNGAIKQVTGTVGVQDGQGNHYATVAYFNITNPNVQILTPPTASILGAGPIAEGQPLTLSASTNQVNAGTYTYAWDLSGNGQYNQAFGPNPTISWADLVQLGISKDGSYPIHLRVTDPQGRVAETTATLDVTRTAPSLAISSSQSTIHVGDTYALAVQFSRPGSEGVTSFTINWGDGTPSSTYTSIPTQATHTYTSTSNATGFAVVATLVDSESVTTTSNTLHVVSSVFNRAPVASAGGAYTIAEGGTLVLDASGTTNPDGNTLTYRWTINGHSSSSQGGPTLTIPWATLGTTYGVSHFTAGATVGLTVTDNQAHTSTASTSLVVTASAPTVTASGPAGATAVTVAEGQPLTLNLGFAAFGQGDALKSWTINWGDGTTSNLGGVTSASHTYTVAPREYQVVATAADSRKNSIAANPIDVVVSTVAPTLSFSGPTSTFANSSYTLSLAASAVDAAGLGAWTINWGDGTTSTAAGGAATATHVYATPAAADNISAQEVYEGTTYNAHRLNSALYVEPVAVVAQGPANLVLTPGSAAVAEGGIVLLGGSFTDANAGVAHTVTINWGDGTTSSLSLPAGATTFNPSHQYLDNPAGQPAGSDSIQVTVAQPAIVFAGHTFPGPSTSGTTSIQVDNVAPSQVTLIPIATKVAVGGTFSVSGSFADPGTLDSHAVDINWGDGSGDTYLSLAAGVTAIPMTSHTYGAIADGLSARTLPVSVTVTDKDGGVGTGGTAVEVDNLATSLAASAASGTYGGTAALSAILTSGSSPVVGQVVSFTLGGKPAGMAVTDAHGVAMLPGVPLGNLGVGTYAGQVGASFGPASGYAATATTAALTVTAAPLTVTANPASRPVGAPDPAFGVTYSGFVAGDGPAVLGGTLAYTSTATAASGVGSYTINPSGLTALNYAIRYVGGTLTVGKVHLTVTVKDADMGHGDPLPVLTDSISGFVNGDTAAVVSGAAALQTAVTGSSPAGRYAITAGAGTLSAANYDFVFVPGTLTVHPKVTDVRVDWGTQSMSLIGLNRDLPFVDITALDVIFSDDVSVTAAELALRGTATAASELALRGTATAASAYGFTKFSYNPTTHDATWTLPSALGIDNLMLSLNGPVGAATSAIPLAGATSWNFSVLPGDFNGDGVVNSNDMVGVRNQTPAFLAPQVLPSPFADIDGNGVVDLNDINVARSRIGTRLP